MGGQGDSDWESAEEDAPAVRLEELLGNMKLEGDDSEKEEENKEIEWKKKQSIIVIVL